MARTAYAYDLNAQKQRKIEIPELPEFKVLKTNKKLIKSKKFRSTLVLSILFTFAMFMAISYRYNIISEKNLEVQKLEKSLIEEKSALANSEIKLDKAVDLSKVETYSKGQLGMQKPEKTQMVYLDVENASNTKTDKKNNIFSKIVEFVKVKFSK